MLWESSNDLFGHRKGFLSAGVTSGVRPGCRRHLRGCFRRPQWAAAFTGHTHAEDGGSKSTQSCPAADIQQNKTKQQNKTVVCVLMEQGLSARWELDSELLRNCLGANPVAWFSHQWCQHLIWSAILAYISTAAWYFELASLKRSKFSSLLPSNRAPNVKLLWHFKVRRDFSSDFSGFIYFEKWL